MDSHPDIDIATFMITDREISTIGRLAYQGAIGDDSPAKGDLIGLVGFPAAGTRRPNVDEVIYGALVATGEVSAIGDRYIKSQAEREYWEPALGAKLLPEEFHYGGISGGPVIWAHVSAAGLLATSLAGVVIEGPNSSPDPNQSISGFEVITARRSHFIRPDGCLDWEKWENAR